VKKENWRSSMPLQLMKRFTKLRKGLSGTKSTVCELAINRHGAIRLHIMVPIQRRTVSGKRQDANAT
jgi:hypothetical protein